MAERRHYKKLHRAGSVPRWNSSYKKRLANLAKSGLLIDVRKHDVQMLCPIKHACEDLTDGFGNLRPILIRNACEAKRDIAFRSAVVAHYGQIGRLDTRARLEKRR